MLAIAEHFTAAAFLNSLLREWEHHARIPGPNWAQSPESIRLTVAGENYYFPLRRFSATGRHEYTGQFFREKSRLSFPELAATLASKLAAEIGVEAAQADLFHRRAGMSTAVLARTLAERGSGLRALFEQEPEFLQTEQGLPLGHPFHPSPKSRDEFSEADLASYSPEMGARFPLHWLRVPKDSLFASGSKPFGHRDWRRELFQSEFGHPFAGTGEPFPVHPWQKPKILALFPATAIEDLGAGEHKWAATSSLRSVYRADSPWMLKFSLSVRLTNSVRHLQYREVERSLQVHDVFTSAPGREFLASEPNFHLLYEPAFAALKGANGEPLPQTIVVIRENLFINDRGRGVALLGALTQDHPFGGESLVAQQVRIAAAVRGESRETAARLWFGRFLERALRPLLRAQSELGVMLGAHQQNLLLGIENNLPATAYFRDCQGSGYSRQGFERLGPHVASLHEANGNVLNEKMGNTLFSYYLVINSTFGLISALAQAGHTSEETLLVDLRAFLADLRAQNPPDASCLEYLLDSPVLWQKGNFFCCLRGINENTSADPLGLYNSIPNPIAGAKHWRAP